MLLSRLGTKSLLALTFSVSLSIQEAASGILGNFRNELDLKADVWIYTDYTSIYLSIYLVLFEAGFCNLLDFALEIFISLLSISITCQYLCFLAARQAPKAFRMTRQQAPAFRHSRFASARRDLIGSKRANSPDQKQSRVPLSSFKGACLTPAIPAGRANKRRRR